MFSKDVRTCPKACSSPGTGILILGRKTNGEPMRPGSYGLAWHQRIAEWLCEHRQGKNGTPEYRPCLMPTAYVEDDGEGGSRHVPALRVSKTMQHCDRHSEAFDDVMAFAKANDLQIIER